MMRGLRTWIGTGSLRARRAADRFRREEDGIATLLVLILIMLTIPMIGLVITLTRAEHLRTKVQGTMDRAVLAAADIDQTLSPRDVVLDYFAKAGLSAYIDPASIVVNPDDDQTMRTGRSVKVCGRGFINTNITDFNAVPDAEGNYDVSFGRDFENFGFNLCSGAEEAKTDIEVTLVLDVSGSMNSSSRLVNLKVAAKDFVDTVLSGNDADGEVGITIVPYAGQVNAEPLFPYYAIEGVHTYGYCVNFPATSFASSQILAGGQTSLPRADVFDPWYTSKAVTLTYCPLPSAQRILPMTNDASVLKTHIDTMIAAGNTSLDIGMKWGVGMMDPSFRPVNQALIAAGQVPSTFSDRPFDYTARSTAKFIVLMSDGQNTDEYILNDPYRSGLSNIWRNSSGQITAYHDRSGTTADYYRFDNLSWSTSPYTDSTRLSWPDVWASYPIRWVAQKLYDDPLGWSNSQRDNFILSVRGATAPATKDQRTSEICRTAKNSGITVFTIGFEAPEVGNAALRDCATSPGHFFDVDGVQISEAFQVIARRIAELRLTQ
jgi:Flp pilus assembly protein TadG